MKVHVDEATASVAGVPCARAPVVALAHQRVALKAALVLTDVCALAVAFGLAYWVRFDLRLSLAPDVVPHPEFYPSLVALLIPLWILMLALFGLYDAQARLGGIVESSWTFNACTTATMLVIVATFAFPQFVVSRVWLVSAWLLSFLTVAANRFVARRAVYALRRRGYLLTPAVVVGTNEEAVALAAFLNERHVSGVQLLGFLSTGNEDGEAGSLGLPVLGTTDDVRRIIAEHEIEDVIVAVTALARDALLDLYEETNPVPGVYLRLSSGLYELLTARVTVRAFGTMPLLSLDKVRLEPEEAWVKTAVEYPLAALLLLVLGPILLLLAVLIKLDSRGPVLYRRRVLGVSGVPFDALKFRTMHVDGDERLRRRPDAAEELRNHHKIKSDPRVTRIGRWLRRFSLDELPQLFNVLRGQMSLVGPRMITPEETVKYGRHKLNLLTVKPGLTGLWQVSGRSDLSYDERVRLDMYYIRNYSVWLDLQILFVETLPAVFRGRGAY